MDKKSVCPWWLGYFLINPFRKYLHNPENILGPYLKKGMKVIDYGSAMGYFSLPMAKMVGEKGKVYCFDIQEKMLDKLASRAKKSGLENIIEPCLISGNDKIFNDLNQHADFALLFAVAHEVPDREQLFKNLYGMLKSKSILLFSEPAGHVPLSDFLQSISYAEKAGFIPLIQPKIGKGHSILLEKE